LWGRRRGSWFTGPAPRSPARPPAWT
jgi:hypothetical protein